MGSTPTIVRCLTNLIFIRLLIRALTIDLVYLRQVHFIFYLEVRVFLNYPYGLTSRIFLILSARSRFIQSLNIPESPSLIRRQVQWHHFFLDFTVFWFVKSLDLS